jgi:hypothetical protein
LGVIAMVRFCFRNGKQIRELEVMVTVQRRIDLINAALSVL